MFILYRDILMSFFQSIFTSSDGVASTVGLSSDAIKAHSSMKAVSTNPEALAREITKLSPDIVFKVLAYDAGKFFNIGGYFISAGVDVLDPNVWKGAALYKLRIELTKLNNDGVIDISTFVKLQRKLSSEPAYVNKMIVIYKLQRQWSK